MLPQNHRVSTISFELTRTTDSVRTTSQQNSDMSIRTLSPVNQEVVVERQETSSAELDTIFAQSAAAFKTYAKSVPLPKRLAIASRFLDLVDGKSDELSKEITVQMGRPLRYTPIEVRTAVMRGRYMIKVAEEALKDEPADMSDAKLKRFLRKMPVGPCYIIGA